MTSNDTSSPSLKATTLVPISSEQLLAEPKRLRAVVRVLGTAAWEDLEQWFLAERQDNLERSVESNDPEKRANYRAVAVWLKHFILSVKEELMAADKAERHPEPPTVTDPMPFDTEGAALAMIPIDEKAEAVVDRLFANVERRAGRKSLS